eukprot:UN04760
MNDKTQPIIYDCETGDPDDLFAMAFLASRPEVKIVAITITPGSKIQVGVIRKHCKKYFKYNL